MKKMIAMVLGMLMLLTAPLALADGDRPDLTVTGTGVVTLTPDFATLTLGVNTQADTVTAAQEENAARMNALLAALKALGIAQEDMQTNYFNVSPVYDYGTYDAAPSGTPGPRSYQVDNSLLVTLRDLSLVSKTLDEAMKAGANQSYGLSFESSKKAEAYDQALQNAAAEAGRKAKVLAAASGKTLGDLKSVAEQPAGYQGGYVTAAKMMDSAMGTPVLAGTLTVEATVEMTYELK